MDQNENQQSSLFEMDLDNEARYSFGEMARWAKFLAIVAIVGLSLFILFFLAFGKRIAYAMTTLFPGEITGLGTAVVVIMLIVVAICAVLLYFLFRASNGIRTGITTNSQEIFNDGLNSLKIYFMIYGILSILTTLSSILNAF
jgi:hypothetical protein